MHGEGERDGDEVVQGGKRGQSRVSGLFFEQFVCLPTLGMYL